MWALESRRPVSGTGIYQSAPETQTILLAQSKAHFHSRCQSNRCVPVTEESTEWLVFSAKGAFPSSCAICGEQCETMTTEKLQFNKLNPYWLEKLLPAFATFQQPLCAAYPSSLSLSSDLLLSSHSPPVWGGKKNKINKNRQLKGVHCNLGVIFQYFQRNN